MFLGEQLDLFYQVGTKRSVAVKCDTPPADDNYPRPKSTTQQEILIPVHHLFNRMLVKLRGRPLVGGLPTGSFFPGAFQGQPEKIFLVQQVEIGNLKPLVRRMIILTPRPVH